MTDERLIDLFWRRDESAIVETDRAYGRYCHTVARNILGADGDTGSCVDDTYMSVWQNIPPTRPSCFRAYIARITRNIALNMLDYFRADKRRDNSALVLDEFWECVPSGDMPIDDDIILREAINGFLATLKPDTRRIFMQRYWYFYSVREIARSAKMTETNVKVILHRTRKDFKSYLERREISI